MHLRCCPERLVFEEQVDSIGDMDQVGDPTNLSMHAMQACNLAGQFGLHEAVPVSPVELLVAFSPVDKGFSKIATDHFYLGVPLVALCAARGSAFIQGCIRRRSHRIIGKLCCLAPAVNVDNLTQLVDASICPGHDNCVLLAQEGITFSLTGHRI